MSKFMWSTIGITCGLVFVTSVYAMESDEKPTDPQQTNQELIDEARDKVIASLHNLKDLVGTRSAREPGMCPPGQCYPTCPQQIDPILEQIRCILCSIKCNGICEIDHIDEWVALIEAIACHPIEPRVPKDFCDALAQLADGLTELLHRVGCGECNMSMPDDILGRLCFISSQIEVVDEKVNTVESKVFKMNGEILDLTEKVDNIAYAQGQKSESVDCSIVNETNCDAIMAMDLSVVQWLKAIFAKIK